MGELSDAYAALRDKEDKIGELLTQLTGSRRLLEEAKDEAQKWRESFGRIQRTFDHTEGERIEACEKSANLRRQLEEARGDLASALENIHESTLIEEGLRLELQAENERLREAAREVPRISDRKHDAWDRLRRQLEEAREWKDIYHQLCTLVLEAFTINEGKINLVATLQAENERLREALHDIAGGHTCQYVDAPDVMAAESPEALQHDMWTWSQKVARSVLVATGGENDD